MRSMHLFTSYKLIGIKIKNKVTIFNNEDMP